jgi:sugar (glycoside-pentoside-hexuronide) transporter
VVHDPGEERLATRVKAGYALGDHAVNVQLAATSLFYLFFLTEVAGLRPSLAGLVLLVGRAFDAFSDPAMGRLSDAVRWRAGRRRPFFLIGAVPFGVTLALLFSSLGPLDDVALFAAYAGIYVCNTLSSTILAVPYMALLPEMALSYEERTSANAWRMGGVVLAVLGTAVSVRPLVEWLGGGPEGWGRAGIVLGVWVTLPWIVVYSVSFERREFRQAEVQGWLVGARDLLAHRAYLHLGALFLAARIATDVIGAMLIFWFTYWLRREGDFSAALGLMLGTVVVTLPVWLWLAARFDKRTLFAVGALWWIAMQGALFLLGADDPRWLVLTVVGLAGIGYGVCDLMPWSMLGDAIDEAELGSGERREGIYAGVFTFLRKLGGALGVAVAGFVLDAAGFVRGAPQEDSALLAIRVLTTAAPALFLVVAVGLAVTYPLTRRRHAEVQAALRERRQ